MDMNFENYDKLLEVINKNTEELAKVNEKIANIVLTKEEEKLLEKIMNGYKEDKLLSAYLKEHLEEYKNYKNLYRYLKLYKKGIETNEEITVMVNMISDEVVEDEE